MPARLSRKLRLLRDADSIDDREYAELLRLSRSRKKMTKRQRETGLRNLRRGCKKIMKPCKSRSTGATSTEHQVKKLRAEISETFRQEQLKAELKDLRAQRQELRDMKKRVRVADGYIL